MIFVALNYFFTVHNHFIKSREANVFFYYFFGAATVILNGIGRYRSKIS